MREGSFYTIADLANMLVDSEATTEQIDPDFLLQAIVGWGKTGNEPRESLVAANAVRELGRLRGQPLFPSLDPDMTQVDLLQLTLIVLHLTGAADQIAETSATRRIEHIPFGASVARAADDCRAIYDKLQLKPYAGSGTGSTVGNTVLKDAFFEWLSSYGEAQAAKAAQVKDALKYLDYASKLANLVIFLTSIELKIEPNKYQTHFRHEPADTSRDVAVTATAKWHQGETLQDLRCLQGLLGIDTQADGPMPGLRVRWRLEQEQARNRTGHLLRAKLGQARNLRQPATAAR